MVRLAYLSAYALLAALGEALVARPALLWLRGQGLLGPALPWEVPLGGIALLCAALVAVATLWLASDAALGRRPRVPQHAAFLLLLAICFGVRSWGGEPRPPRDPTSALLDGLRAAAAELDRDYRGSYTPDAGQLNSALAQVTPPGYRRLGRSIPLHARVLSGADGPQLSAMPGDLPGTIYVAISKDRTAAWLTALGLNGVLKARVETHGGTHSQPGRDPLVPIYPGMRGLSR
ncbi:MAG: hypothetical protein ABR567_02055 [Myxococcales bacterium]